MKIFCLRFSEFKFLKFSFGPGCRAADCKRPASDPSGLLRDAEKQFKSALKDEEMITTHLELCKVYLRRPDW